METQEKEIKMNKRMRPSLKNLDVNEWKQKAQEEQNQHHETSRMSYMRFKDSERSLIKQKILCTFFEGSADSDDYTFKQRSLADKLCTKIIKISASNEEPGVIYMTFIYVLGRTKKTVFQEPVIRVLQSKDANGLEKHFFVDRLARVYDGWQDWLKYNKLGKCTYCYPRNGVYCGGNETGTVLVDFGKPPACSAFANVMRIMNVVVTLGTVIILVIFCVSLFAEIPPAYLTTINISQMIEAVYVAFRCILELRDKYKHKECLYDWKAIYIWLALFGTFLDLIFSGENGF